jgi:beta-1,4-galactosyltransferase 1
MERIFGGATSFRPEVFEWINGYSNEFYGWGGEDDDILNR